MDAKLKRGRPPLHGEPMVGRVRAVLTADVLKRLKREARMRGWTVSAVVREAVEEYLESRYA